MTRKEEIEARKVELRNEIQNASNIEELNEKEKEVDALNEEETQIESQEKNKTIADEMKKQESVIKEIRKEERKMNNEKLKEVRNSKKYIDAYAEYIKTGKDEEVRTLLSENATDGTIAVPDFVLDEVKTAWEKSDIMSLVTKTELKGNLKIQFEISGSDAVVHTEGSGAVDEEDLKEGIATISPASIKEWISISDEVMDLRGEKFLSYIYNQLTYRIVKKATNVLIAKIAALPQTATKTSPSAVKIAIEPKASTIATAFANLSDEASNPVITMNKLTYAKFKEVQYANNYGVDIFEGFDVKFNNTLPSYETASSGDVYMIVGDYGQGAAANFPNGDEVNIKFDELTRKKEDLVEILGRQYVGVGIVADKAFTLVAKPELTV